MIKQTLTMDLHIHSEYSSDSSSSICDLVDSAFKKHIDVIAITDHFVDKAFVELTKYQEKLLHNSVEIVEKYETFIILRKHKLTLILVRGKEVSTQGGFHILALAYNGKIHNSQGVEDTLLQIRDHNGICIIAHPCNTISHGIGEERLRELANNITTSNNIDAIEIFNANGPFPMFWNNASSETLAKKLNLPGIATSDAHQARHVGCSATVFQGSLDCNSDFSFVSSFRKVIRHSDRKHIKKYVPFAEHVEWFYIPKLQALLKGRPLRSSPPPDYEDF